MLPLFSLSFIFIAAHKLLNKSIYDLGLKVIDFGPPAMPFPDSNAYFRGQHMKYRDTKYGLAVFSAWQVQGKNTWRNQLVSSVFDYFLRSILKHVRNAHF